MFADLSPEEFREALNAESQALNALNRDPTTKKYIKKSTEAENLGMFFVMSKAMETVHPTSASNRAYACMRTSRHLCTALNAPPAIV